MQQIYDTQKINFSCEIHKNTEVIFVSSLKDDPNIFYCYKCIQRGNISNGTLLPCGDNLETDWTKPIYNWPPGILEEQFQFLENKQTDLMKDKLREYIMVFYDSLQQQFNSLINESRKQQLLQLDQTKFGSKEILKFYNKQFKRNELTKILQNLNAESKDKFRQLLDSMLQSSPTDLEQLKLMIQEKKDSERKFREFQAQHISELTKKINSIIDGQSHPLFNCINSDLIQKFDFQALNNIQIEENIQSQYNENPSKHNDNKNMNNNESMNSKKKMQLMTTRMFISYSHDKFEIDYFLNYETDIKNKDKISGKILSQSGINLQYKYMIKLKFLKLQDLINFNFGFYIITKKNEKQYVKFQDFWQQIIKKLDNQNIKEYQFSLFYDFGQQQLKLTSNCFDDEKTLQFEKYNRSEHYLFLAFYINENCDGFRITEYSLTK